MEYSFTEYSHFYVVGYLTELSISALTLANVYIVPMHELNICMSCIQLFNAQQHLFCIQLLLSWHFSRCKFLGLFMKFVNQRVEI